MYWIAKGDDRDQIYNECCSQSFSVLDAYVLHDYKSRASEISGGRGAAKLGGNLIKYMSLQHIWNLFQL